jgi:hypothetical protein
MALVTDAGGAVQIGEDGQMLEDGHQQLRWERVAAAAAGFLAPLQFLNPSSPLPSRPKR